MWHRLTVRGLVVRTELALGALALALAVVSLLVTPRFFGGPEAPTADLVRGAGVAGILVGLAWMRRLAFRDPEAGPSPWRYRGE